MAFRAEPKLDLAEKILPRPLYECLTYFFQQNIPGLVLVGGTALSGFYAGHRRSDDLDLFTKDQNSQKSAVVAAKTLVSSGVKLSYEFQTNEYYKATCELRDHIFTIDIVLDENFFKVGQFQTLHNGITVASLETLLMTKAATLVSRCGEKDLYDLLWLFDQDPELDFKKLMECGRKIDSGVNGEAMLLSISGTKLRPEACDFGISVSAENIYKIIVQFQKELILNLSLFLKNQPPLPLKKLIQKIKILK